MAADGEDEDELLLVLFHGADEEKFLPVGTQRFVVHDRIFLIVPNSHKTLRALLTAVKPSRYPRFDHG